MSTLSMTRKTANTLITAAGMNVNMDEIEAVCNALTSANLAAGSVLAAAFGADVVRANYGLIKHSDGSLYVDLSDTTPGLELTDGGLRVKSYGLIQRVVNGLEWGVAGDMLLTSRATTPDGFSDVSATYADKFIRISSTALTAAGSDTHDHGAVTGSHTLTVAEMPAHTHESGLFSGSGVNSGGGASGATTPINTESAGGGGGHTHTITSANNVPAYITLRMCQKN